MSAGTIGRANLDGTGVDQNFITGASFPRAVAIDATHIYWANTGSGSIGRADRDGTGIDQNFIITGATFADGVAIDAGHVYWTDALAGTIGRANLDGTDVDNSFITGARDPEGVAVDASHIYWGNARRPSAIGRANLDGTGVNQTFIPAPAAGFVRGPAVDASHIYWAITSGEIGRANLDGTNVDNSFITGATSPFAVSVDDRVHWTNSSSGTIGRANLDGTGVDQSFITGASTPTGIAVDQTVPAAPTLTGTDPASPSNDQTPLVKGTLGAGDPTQVRIFTSSDCSGAAITGTAAAFTDPGIEVTVTANSVTALSAKAVDAGGDESTCSNSISYTHDNLAPGTPVITDTDPDSPVDDNNPEVKGTVIEEGGMVRLYAAPTAADCTQANLIGSGAAAAFIFLGITVSVADDTSTTLRATATDQAGNVSGCSGPFTYIEDSTPPPAPVISGSDPASPANDNGPEIKGSVAGSEGTTVKLFTSSDCSGTPLAVGSETGFEAAGITVSVADDTSTTLRATATDQAGNVSGCSNPFTYTEDSTAPTAPTITATSPASPANDNNPEVRGTGAETNSTVRLYAAAAPADCVQANLIGSGTAAVFNGTNGISVTVPDDTTTQLRATATDAAGNVSGCSGPFTYTEDSTAPAAPTITATSPVSPADDNSPEVRGTAEGGGTVRLYAAPTAADCTQPNQVGSGAAAVFNGFPGITVTVADDATTQLRATVTDRAGNVSPCSAAFAYVEDSTAPAAPAITATDPASPANENNPEVEGSGAEAGSTVRLYAAAAPADCVQANLIGSGTAAAFTGTGGITVTVPDDATTQLRATATDGAGNVSACSAAFPYTEDSTAPAAPVIVRTDPDSPANDNSPEVHGVAEAGSTVRLYAAAEAADCIQANLIGTGTAAAFNGTGGIGVAVPDDATTQLRATATDQAGNVSACSDPFAYTEDSTAPETTITDGPSDPTNDDTPTFAFTSEDDASFVCRVDQTELAPCTSAHTTGALEDGEHTFTVHAIDVAGNRDQTPATRTFTVDTTPPETTITAGPDGLSTDSTPSFQVAGEAGASLECSLDPTAASFASCEPAVTLGPLPDGAYTFAARAVDPAGNPDPTPATRAFTVDTTPPDTTITTGPDGPSTDNTPTFSFGTVGPAAAALTRTLSGTAAIAALTRAQAEPGVTFACRIDEDPFAACESPHTTRELSDGQHSFQVRGTDPAGNTDPTPASRTITVTTPTAVLPVTLPSAPSCKSRRNFNLRLMRRRVPSFRRHWRGARITAATVIAADGKTIRKLTYRPARVSVNLRDLPAGRFTLKATVRLRSGRRVTVSRNYGTCAIPPPRAAR